MSFGEIARIALIDTALGMGTVFLILIFISICIWLLGIACGAKPAKKAAPAAAVPAAEPEPEGIRPEVVAAITAAIHQQMKEEELSDDQYIVRNIRRATWRHTS
ncbi:MAG: OadG family protein [Mogibacterium sp.]|nr:OadG family protein [Mogibacterium sp.]MBR2539627.1 OadG family protein [Mogibacterium sp.]